jgi:Ku protein, prokaryotic
MAVSHKGAISFGLVHIPVSLYTATQDNDISFNQLHRDDLSRIRYKKICAHCGKEVSSNDIIKGFEYDKDQYVIMNDDDFEKIKTEKDKTIQIIHFTDLTSIKPIYYDKTYHAVPDIGGDKAFELLRSAMKEESKVAIAKTVFGNKETLLSIIPTEDGILIETMFYEDEIKEIPKSYNKPALSEAEVKMAKTLINSMVKSFEPELYKDEYQEKLREVIEQKISGKDVVTAAPDAAKNNVIDLMEALKASIDQNKPKPNKGKTTSKKTKELIAK